MPSVQNNQSAFFLALEEKKNQMRKDISSMTEQLDQILSKTKSASVNQVPSSCQKPTKDLSEVIETTICLPTFEPVCPFSMVRSHTGEQEEVDPEAEEEVTPQTPKEIKKKSEKKIMILSPIQEEGITEAQVDKKIYKAVFF